MPEGTKTVLALASSKSPSLRSTIPRWIVEQFGLKAGDSLYWKLEAVGGSLKLVVEPSKAKK
ncbi:MAG: AbrB family transcriptional regulator [Thermoplasmata archaeon]|nr:MAG: AbrB family transcriptional regulator [Thermoplasmata archaeon]